MRSVLAISLVTAMGCAGGSAARVPDPGATADRFARALTAGQAEQAYALLHPELRRQVDLQTFKQQFAHNRAELAELAAALQRAEGRARANASVELASAEQVTLVLEEGQWKIADGILDAHSLASPEQTVAALHRSLRRRSLPGLLRLLSQERRAAFAAALERSLQGTADPLDLTVEVRGDEAVVHTSAGGKIHLRRQAGQWRVHDVE